VQVCLWDDERRRLLPGTVPDGGTSSSSGGTGAAPVQLAGELFCFTADALHLHLERQLQLAAGVEAAAEAGGLAGALQHPWLQQPLLIMSARLTAAALQLDSFLPSSEQQVLLTSVPDDSMAAAAGGYGRRRGPAVQLALEVHHCPPLPALGGGAAAVTAAEVAAEVREGMSFRNCWVHNLLIQLPTLAAAADDALLLFIDRASTLLAASGTAAASNGDGGDASLAAVVAGGAAQAASQPVAAEVEQLLAVEAAGAAASRLFTEQAVVESGERHAP
jgi:hypothetical protein